MIANTIAVTIVIAKSIHKGENTHHQLHDITLQSFNTTNATVSRIAKIKLYDIPLFSSFILSPLQRIATTAGGGLKTFYLYSNN